MNAFKQAAEIQADLEDMMDMVLDAEADLMQAWVDYDNDQSHDRGNIDHAFEAVDRRSRFFNRYADQLRFALT